VNTAASQFANQSELQQFFTDIGSLMAQDSSLSQFADQKQLERFFAEIGSRVVMAEKEQRQLDRKEATRFNVFNLIEPDENKLSDVLADLLNPRGKHGQGDLFLRLLFERPDFVSYPKWTAGVRVQREASTYKLSNQRRRIDVLVEDAAGVLLAIENKVDSAEQEDQVKDYLEHLARCSSVSLPLIYLTPDGRLPDSLKVAERKAAQDEGRLHCWSYQRELRDWLAACRQQCASEKIQYFLADFITYIETELKREALPEQPEQADENKSRKRLYPGAGTELQNRRECFGGLA
jgi:hypothetical protein